jgi:hypothetical protein
MPGTQAAERRVRAGADRQSAASAPGDADAQDSGRSANCGSCTLSPLGPMPQLPELPMLSGRRVDESHPQYWACAAVERHANSHVGLRFAAVRYVEDAIDALDHDGDPLLDGPYWRKWPEFDFLGYGLELADASGRVVGVTWGDTWCDHHLVIENRGLVGTDVRGTRGEDRLVLSDVSTTSRWRTVLGEQLAGVRLGFAEQHYADGTSLLSPHVLEFSFGPQRIWISVAGQETHCDDGVVVVFAETVARRLQLCF